MPVATIGCDVIRKQKVSEMLTEARTLPHGGPLGIDEKVAEVIMSHLEGVCAESEGGSEVAFNRRDEILSRCGPAVVVHLMMVGNAIVRLCEGIAG